MNENKQMLLIEHSDLNSKVRISDDLHELFWKVTKPTLVFFLESVEMAALCSDYSCSDY